MAKRKLNVFSSQPKLPKLPPEELTVRVPTKAQLELQFYNAYLTCKDRLLRQEIWRNSGGSHSRSPKRPTSTQMTAINDDATRKRVSAAYDSVRKENVNPERYVCVLFDALAGSTTAIPNLSQLVSSRWLQLHTEHLDNLPNVLDSSYTAQMQNFKILIVNHMSETAGDGAKNTLGGASNFAKNLDALASGMLKQPGPIIAALCDRSYGFTPLFIYLMASLAAKYWRSQFSESDPYFKKAVGVLDKLSLEARGPATFNYNLFKDAYDKSQWASAIGDASGL
jgi:hypothetical protein